MEVNLLLQSINFPVQISNDHFCIKSTFICLFPNYKPFPLSPKAEITLFKILLNRYKLPLE